MSPGDTQPSPPRAPAGPPPPEPEIEPTVAQPPRPPAPDRPAIPGVRLEGEIARGGMGVVYRGVQEYLSRPVAVKVLAQHLHGGDFVARFQREARILSGIAHPNIVACYQAGVTEAGQCYLVMEFIDGPSLRRHTDKAGPLPVPAVLRMGADLARALEHAREAGVIHRDVKPENVVLQRTPKSGDTDFPFVPKLVDLGLARADSVADGLTAPGAVMGTYSTMAPEQFDAPDAVDFRADLYGLGCVLHHALTGKPAFPEPSMAAVIARKLAKPAPNPCERNAAVPGAVGALVQRMLAADREERPASYGEVVAECERLLGSASGTKLGAKSTAGEPPAPPPRPRRTALLAAGAALALAALAVAAWAVTSTRGERAGRDSADELPRVVAVPGPPPPLRDPPSRLFASNPAERLAGWQSEGGAASCWGPYLGDDEREHSVNGVRPDGLARLRRPLPAAVTLAGELELSRADPGAPLCRRAGLWLRPADPAQARAAFALWLERAEGDSVRLGFGQLEHPDVWGPRSFGQDWPLLADPGPDATRLEFRVDASEGEFRVFWRARDGWRGALLPRPPGEWQLELFVRDGLAYFHDLRW